MEQRAIAYLSLGSNMGNSISLLQRAIFRLQETAGEIIEISPVYRSASWGFSGEDFLNACLALATRKSPEELLECILKTETSLGRLRIPEEGYGSRTLDIDILYYDNLVLQSGILSLPHPRMHLRRFVLKPLSDIAPQVYHPLLGKDTRNLLQECRDEIVPLKTGLRLYPQREQLFSTLNFLAIEGNIGAGKTSLAGLIASEFNAKLLLERFADNPFLPKFYEDPGRYAFPLEMSFLADRYQQFTEDTSQFDLFKTFMVSDYDIYKSLIFARITLQQEEYLLYRKIFMQMSQQLIKPGLYIYLHQEVSRLLDNIRKRGRAYEQRIDPAYLEKINRGYLDFVRENTSQRSLILDVSELNFVDSVEDYRKVLDQIEAQLAGN